MAIVHQSTNLPRYLYINVLLALSNREAMTKVPWLYV